MIMSEPFIHFLIILDPWSLASYSDALWVRQAFLPHEDEPKDHLCRRLLGPLIGQRVSI